MRAPSLHLGARVAVAGIAILAGAQCSCEVPLFRADAGPDTGVMDPGDDAASPDASNPASTTTFALTAQAMTARTNTASGPEFADLCAGEHVLVGIDGGKQADGDELVTGVSGICARLSVAPGGVIATTLSAALALHGEAGDVAIALRCPSNHVVVGLDGRAGTSIDRLGVTCAPLTLEGGAVRIGATSPVAPVGGAGGAPFTIRCADGQIARGTMGSVETFVQSFGLFCATPSPSP